MKLNQGHLSVILEASRDVEDVLGNVHMDSMAFHSNLKKVLDDPAEKYKLMSALIKLYRIRKAIESCDVGV